MTPDQRRSHSPRPAALAAVGLLAVAVMAGLPLLSYRSTAAVTATQQQVRWAWRGRKRPRPQPGQGASRGRCLYAHGHVGRRRTPRPAPAAVASGSCACASPGAFCCRPRNRQVLKELREALSSVRTERDSARKELEEARAQVRAMCASACWPAPAPRLLVACGQQRGSDGFARRGRSAGALHGPPACRPAARAACRRRRRRSRSWPLPASAQSAELRGSLEQAAKAVAGMNGWKEEIKFDMVRGVLFVRSGQQA